MSAAAILAGVRHQEREYSTSGDVIASSSLRTAFRIRRTDTLRSAYYDTGLAFLESRDKSRYYR